MFFAKESYSFLGPFSQQFELFMYIVLLLFPWASVFCLLFFSLKKYNIAAEKNVNQCDRFSSLGHSL